MRNVDATFRLCDRIGPLKYSKFLKPLNTMYAVRESCKIKASRNCWHLLNDFDRSGWFGQRSRECLLASSLSTASSDGISAGWAFLRVEASPTALDEAKVQGVSVQSLSISFSRNHWRSSYHVICPSCGIPRSRAFLDESSTSPLPIIYSYDALQLCYGKLRLSVRKASCLMHLNAFLHPWHCGGMTS